ncbi:MAG: hypothetical protein JNN05_03235 [Candidatus Omnitrophica bacterium]|nr:hypothetical protein [Candidatus Omnitrophota bacterium]
MIRNLYLGSVFLTGIMLCQGCTVKAVGDPNRPITINAHITLDIKGLEKTATNIEDYVSGAPVEAGKIQGGK